MLLDRRLILKHTASFGLTVAATGIFGQILLPNVANAQQVNGLFEDVPLPDMVMGSPDAPVTIVEYASMTCPHCQRFHANTLPDLKKNYIDTGKVKLVFREFPLDNLAMFASMLARCAQDGKFFPMVDLLFARQNRWTDGNADPLSEFTRISKLAGMSDKAFEACRKNQKLLNDIQAMRTQAADKFGVSATPTFFINGVKFSRDFSYDNMAKAIDSLL